jgi:hypothetical protein
LVDGVEFLDAADPYGLPCLFPADDPAELAGTTAEGQGIRQHAARLFAIQHRMRGPKLHVTFRKGFGFGSSVMAMNPVDSQAVTLAPTSTRLATAPATSAAEGIDDPDVRARAAAKQSGTSERSDARLSCDHYVDPRDLPDAPSAGLTGPGGVTPGRGSPGLSAPLPEHPGRQAAQMELAHKGPGRRHPSRDPAGRTGWWAWTAHHLARSRPIESRQTCRAWNPGRWR